MRWTAVIAALAACNGGGDCTELASGGWTTDGAAGGGMEMTGTLTMDAKTCTFTMTDWSMAMTNLPDGGTVDGDQVTLSGADIPVGCVGTASEDGTSVEGACEDGSAFSMHQG
jgi:hypothetical protein